MIEWGISIYGILNELYSLLCSGDPLAGYLGLSKDSPSIELLANWLGAVIEEREGNCASWRWGELVSITSCGGLWGEGWFS